MQSKMLAAIIGFVCISTMVSCGPGADGNSSNSDSDSTISQPDAVNSQGEPLIGNVGRAPFSLTSPSFNCSEFIKSIANLPVIHLAVLYNTFGNDFSCWDQIAEDNRLQTIELNLINEPGHRNGRLGDYEFLYGLGSPSDYDRLLRNDDQKLKSKFVNYVALAKKKVEELPDHVQCLINPGLESNVSAEAGKTLIAWTKEQFPTCRTVWNPLNGTNETGRIITGADLVEAHGGLPNVSAPCLVNLDGTDIDFPERPTYMQKGNFVASGAPLMNYIATYANKCEVVFLWTVEDNCNMTSEFVDPRERNCMAAGEAFHLVAREAEQAMATIKQYNNREWTEEENKSLQTCSAIGSSNDGEKRGFLLKQSEFRDRGGVILLPTGIKASKVQILSNGVVIDTYQLSGNYTHDNSNRQLWRSSSSPVSYPFHVVVKASTPSGDICYQIDNPNARND